MIDSHDPPGDGIREAVNCRALELLEFHGDERENRYDILKDQDVSSARASGMPLGDACDMSEKIDQWTRDLVRRILATGGAVGGKA
jgi:hypothetical protein